MKDIGLKVGSNILTSQIKDQVVNSKANSLKIFNHGAIEISVSEFTGFGGTGIGDVDIKHGLGYIPFFLAAFKLKHATKIWQESSQDQSMLFGNFIVGTAYANSENLHLHVDVNGNNLAAFTAVGYYYIFIDEGVL